MPCDSDEERQKITRRRGACRLCREKKVRCNGRKPCSFCEKHQATCTYQPAPPKSSAQAPSQPCTSQSTTTTLPSSVHTRTPGPPSPRPVSRARHDSAVTCVILEHPSESGDLDHPHWPDVADFDNFDKGLNLVDFDFGTPTHDPEALVDPLLPNPSAPSSTISNAVFDIHAFDWSLPANKQDEILAATEELDSHGPEHVAEPTVVPLDHIITGPFENSRASKRSAMESDSPLKKRRLYSVPPTSGFGSWKRERRRSLLFPAAASTETLSTIVPSSYNPYVSALFPSSRRVEHKVGESKKSAVNRIVTRLLSRDYLLGLPTSWAESLTDDQDHEACHSLEDLDALMMEKLVTLCFNEPWGVNCFLNKSDILNLIQKYASSKRGRDLDGISMTDMLLLGVLTTWGATIAADEHPGLACALATQIMDLRHSVSLEPDSIPKFLALVAMLQYAFKAGLAQFPAILAETTSVAQSLNLHLEAGLQGVCSARTNTIRVKRACWILFCVDKIYAMRWRTFSLLPNIEYDPPPLQLGRRDSHESYSSSEDQGSLDEDWLISLCRYAKICARISRGFASLASCSFSAATTAATEQDDDDDSATNSATTEKTLTPQDEAYELLVHSLLTDLHNWYESVPREGRPFTLAKAAASTSSQRHIAISTAYQYHEAVLAVLSLLSQRSSSLSLAVRLPQFPLSSNPNSCSAATILLGSIKGLLTLSNHVSDILDDRTLLHVPTLALCTLAVEHVKGNPVVVSIPSAQRECRALFAMAYGFFGRLAGMLPHSEFFDRVAELFEAVNGC